MIFIATPSHTGDFAGGYVRGREELAKSGRPYTAPSYDGDSLVTRARDALLGMFFQTNATHIMWIDADIGFRGADVWKLVDSGHDFICGPYPKKRDPNQPRTYIAQPTQGKGLEPVELAGTGFMCWSRSAAKKLWDLHKDDWYRLDREHPAVLHHVFKTPVVNGVLLSEDYWVCLAWQHLGGQVMMDWDIKLTHKGSFTW
jgi:hypothetical protein